MNKQYKTVTLSLLLCLLCSNIAIAQIFIPLRPVIQLPLQLRECSGIAITHKNLIWAHNDSGNTNQLFSIDTTGAVLRTLTIGNIQNTDWEDLARDPQGNIYINDAGNNDNNRANLAIHKIPNPDLHSGSTLTAQSIYFVFPDQTAFPPPASNRNFDIEATIWHNDSIVLFSKNRSTPSSGYSKMYILPATPGVYTARLKDSIFIGTTTNDRVTAAAFNHQTQSLLLLTRAAIIMFDNFQGNDFFKGRKTIFCFATLPGQAEGLDFFSNNGVYITEEGTSSAGGMMYEATITKPAGLNPNYEEPYRLSYVDGNFYLIWNRPETVAENITVYDATGKIVAMLSHTNKLNVSGWRNGIYIAVISAGHVQYRTKISIS